MSPKKSPGVRPVPPSKFVDQLTAALRLEVAAQLGPTSTFEQRREAGARLMSDVLAKVTEEFRAEDEARTKGGR